MKQQNKNLSSSLTEEFAGRDLRGNAVDRLREKQKRVRSQKGKVAPAKASSGIASVTYTAGVTMRLPPVAERCKCHSCKSTLEKLAADKQASRKGNIKAELSDAVFIAHHPKFFDGHVRASSVTQSSDFDSGIISPGASSPRVPASMRLFDEVFDNAVNTLETKQLEKLLNTEYEVVDDTHENQTGHSSSSAEEEDYEFV